MGFLLDIALANLVVAGLLALTAALVGLWGRRPAVTHALWLLVLLKLITPPLFDCPVPWLTAPALPNATNPERQRGDNAAPQAFNAQHERPDDVAQRDKPAEPPADLTSVRSDSGPVDDPPAPNPNPKAALVGEPAIPGDVAPPIVPAAPPVAPVQAPVEPDEAIEEAVNASAWPNVVLLVWFAGSCLWFVVALRRLWRFHRILRVAEPAPASVQDLARGLADYLRVRCPVVCIVPGTVSPMLWTLGRGPRLLLPAGLLERLNTDQLATLLAHELAHWRRRDDRVRWLELAVLALYWWCPLVWWACRELHQAEEECCDAWVVSILPDSAKAYALALVETVDFLSGAPALPVLASGMGRVRLLKRRLTMILQGKTPRALTFTGLLAVAGVGLLMLPMVFSRAQAPGEEVAAQPENKKFGGKKGGPGDPNRQDQAQQARDEVRRLQEDIQRRQAELQQRMAELEKIVQRLQQIEAGKGGPMGGQAGKGPMGGQGGPGGGPDGQNKKGGPGGGGFPPMGGGGGFPGMPGGLPGMPPGGFPGGGGGGPGNIGQRLNQLEQKLDTLLEEIRALRGAMKQGPKGPFPKGGPQPGGNQPNANNPRPNFEAPIVPRPPQPPQPPARPRNDDDNN